MRQRADGTLAHSLHWSGAERLFDGSADAEPRGSPVGTPVERRHVDQEQAPPGAAAEAAIAQTVELEGVQPVDTHAVEADEHARERQRSSVATLAVAAIGIVFGDIGTSPLYVMRAAFTPEQGLAATQANVFGLLSLITWGLILVVSGKYVSVVMRANNRGEGGVLALLALLIPDLEHGRSSHPRLWIGAGLLGAAMLFADGFVTPAISVLSAVEGLNLVSTELSRYVVPLSIGILIGLFSVQRRGTARIGRVFGPIMITWFVTLGTLGALQIMRSPGILAAASPVHAVRFFAEHGPTGLLILGVVILAVSGVEALFADMGHFGRGPIRLVWFALVLPSLFLNYFGQGALVLADPDVSNPFFQLAPSFLLYPLIALATAAAVIASQALISGAFSFARQLMHLGYSPFVTVVHTSPEQEGQIYIRQINAILLVGCVALIIAFRSSASLVGAYGVALATTMVITTVLFFEVTRWEWKWSLPKALAVATPFLVIDVAFFTANLAKIPRGGWVPLTIAGMAFFLFITWRRGRDLVLDIRQRMALPITELIERVEREKPCRTPGTGVFLTPTAHEAPDILRQHLEHIHALHQQVILLSVSSSGVARVPVSERIVAEQLPLGFAQVTARYGYMQSVALADILTACTAKGVCVTPETTTFYVSRERLRPTGGAPMARWRKRLFIFLRRNTPKMQDFFDLPVGRVVELGTTVEI